MNNEVKENKVHSVNVLNVVVLVLSVTTFFVMAAIGLLYYFKIDPFLPPALSFTLIPLIIQARAASDTKNKILKQNKMQKRALDMAKNKDEYLLSLKNSSLN